MKHDNGVEVEYKFLVKDRDVLVAIIESICPKVFQRSFQSNTMYDNQDGVMGKTNGRIRVRAYQDGRKLFTYKKPLSSIDGAKKETEYQVDVVDKNGSLEKILEKMGSRKSTSYQRYQTGWELMGVAITLDEYPFADFLEIEGKLKDIKIVAKKLGFDIKTGLLEPVDTLFQKWRELHGLNFKPHMNFDDYDK